MMQEDAEAMREKALHQSKLAVRRLRSQLRQKGTLDEGSIASAMILAKAAKSLIRGGPDVSLGWDHGPRTASLLCFDEMQVILQIAGLACTCASAPLEGCSHQAPRICQ